MTIRHVLTVAAVLVLLLTGALVSADLLDFDLWEDDEKSYTDKVKDKLGAMGVLDVESGKWTYLGQGLYRRTFDDNVVCYAYENARSCVKPGLLGWLTGYEVTLVEQVEE